MSEKDVSKDLYCVQAISTKNVIHLGSYEECQKECGRYNSFYVDEIKFAVVPHQTTTYADIILSRQPNFKNKKGLVKIILPKKLDPPPKLIPEPTISERVKEYLNKLKK